MSDRQTTSGPNLQLLGDAYDILGELRIGDLSQMYIAKRRQDGANVVISVVRAPTGGGNNALTHYAADTQLLSKLQHAQVPQVIEGRWVGKDEFAVITERRTSTTLGEQLARGEQFTPPRVATILHDVSAILDWARSNGVVHRGVTPDTLAFEHGTNRVLVSFAPTPIPIEGVPDTAADARTIGLLAWVMLTGETRSDDRPLSEVRPDLAKRVTDETDAMVRAKSGGHLPDVPTFLAVVAAADALRAGELEVAETEAAILEARRAELAAFEAEQQACAMRNKELEEQLANERREFERRMAEEEAELASVKAEFAALKAHEESQIALERRQFEQEHREFEDRLAELEARRAEVDVKLAELAKLRSEEGKRINAAIAAAVETVAASAAAAPPASGEDHEKWNELSVDPKSEPWVAETVRSYSVETGDEVVTDVGPATRPRWMMAAAGVAGVLVVATLALGYANRTGTTSDIVKVGNSTIVTTPPTTDVHGVPRGGFLTQSAGGAVAPHIGPPLASPVAASTNVSTPTAPSDSVSLPPGAAEPTPKPVRAPATVKPARAQGALSVEAEAIERADSARRDSVDRIARRRDSTARRDSASRRDTLRVRADTLRAPPDTLR